MKKEVADKLFKEKGIVQIPHYKKIWYSITKFEKYPEMATEGVGRAIFYLTRLMIAFAIIVAIATTIKMNNLLKTAVDYLNENISEINYNEGNLSIKMVGEGKEFVTDIGTVVVNTDETNIDRKNSSNNIEIIWLKDHVSVNLAGVQNDYYYKNVLEGFGITSFDKEDFVQFINNGLTNNPRVYISYFIMMFIYMFIAYFIATLINIIVLSIFGVLTSMIAKIQMRYRAIFNMSVYSVTISVILQLIYTTVNLFTDFKIKHFDLMYTAISYICLTAAIFMIKSDVIKQHIELMKVIKEKEMQKTFERDEKEQEERKEDKKEEQEDKEEKKENDGLNEETGGEGSKA